MTDVPNPSIPAVADLFSPRTRTVIYLLSVVLAAAFGVVTANVDLHWAILAGYAGWNAGVGLIAVSNTPSTRSGDDRGAITIVDVFYVVAIVAILIWIYHEVKG